MTHEQTTAFAENLIKTHYTLFNPQLEPALVKTLLIQALTVYELELIKERITKTRNEINEIDTLI